MPASNANPGFGILFAVGDGASPEDFSNVLAEITNVSGFGTSHRTAEVTHMTSPDGWVEHIKLGVKEGKAFTLALNFVADDVDQVSLFQTRLEGTEKHNYQITFTDDSGSAVIFEAAITDSDITHDRDSKADMTVSVLPSGAYSWS